MSTAFIIAGLLSAIAVNIFSDALSEIILPKIAGAATPRKRAVLRIVLSISCLSLALLPFVMGSTPPAQTVPKILDIQANPNVVRTGSTVDVSIIATGKGLTYLWLAERGDIISGPTAESTVAYKAPLYATRDTVKVTVVDQSGSAISGEVLITVVNE